MTSKKKSDDAPVVAVELGTVVNWPLDCLALSPINVRKHDVLEDLDALADDIAAKGLLQSLIVHPGPAGPDDPGRLVAGGQRRYLALCKLVKAGRLPKNASIPVRDLPEGVALEASLAENFQRRDMTPGDELRAFKALYDLGTHDETTIAKRFGLTPSFVKRRMKLAELAPEILAALDAKEITIDQAMAYATAGAPEAQKKIFDAQCKSSWKPHEKDRILDAVNAQAFDADGPLGKLLGGAKAYEKAGGTFEATMFDDLFAVTYGKKRKRMMTDKGVVAELWAAHVKKAEPKLKKEAEEKLGLPVGAVVFPAKPKTDGSAGIPKGYTRVSLYTYSYGARSDRELDKTEWDQFRKELKEHGTVVAVRPSLSGWQELKWRIDDCELLVPNDAAIYLDKIRKARAKRAEKEAQQREAEKANASIEHRAARLYLEDGGTAEVTALFQRALDAGEVRLWPVNDEKRSIRMEFNIYAERDDYAPYIEQAKAELKAEAEAAAKAEAEQAAAAEDAKKASLDLVPQIMAGTLAAFEVLDGDGACILSAQRLDGGDYAVFYDDGDEEIEPSIAADMVAEYINSGCICTLPTVAAPPVEQASETVEA